LKVGTSLTPTFTDSPLTAATQYSYEVTAVGKNGMESAKSKVITATTTGAGA